MTTLHIFCFSLANGQRFLIAAKSMKSALRTLQRLTPLSHTLIHFELRIRILLQHAV